MSRAPQVEHTDDRIRPAQFAGQSLGLPVIAGLDPAIHHFDDERFFSMDARVKPR
jgi:phosphohistidine swiveling domain-containing protein